MEIPDEGTEQYLPKPLNPPASRFRDFLALSRLSIAHQNDAVFGTGNLGAKRLETCTMGAILLEKEGSRYGVLTHTWAKEVGLAAGLAKDRLDEHGGAGNFDSARITLMYHRNYIAMHFSGKKDPTDDERADATGRFKELARLEFGRVLPGAEIDFVPYDKPPHTFIFHVQEGSWESDAASGRFG